MHIAASLAAPTASRSSRRAEAMRAAILDGAKRLFLAEGYERASMDALAAAIGASKMTIYRHFRSKEALFAGIVQAMCDTVADPQRTRAMARLPLRAALEAFGRRSMEIIFDPDTVALHRVVIAECRHFPELGRMFYERGPAMNVAALAAYLERDAPRPVPRARAAELAAEFLSVLRGYEHMRALLGLEAPPDQAQRERQVDRAVAHLMRVLG